MKNADAPRPGVHSIRELVNLDDYDLDGLRSDIVDLANLPDAVAKTALWTLAGPIVVAAFTWAYFTDKMATWALVPFTIVAVLLSVVASVLIAVYIVSRKRIEEATQASSRVLDTISLAQDDLERLAAGEIALSVRDLTTEVLESAVFPGLEDGVVQTVPWPLTYAARPLVWLPRQMIQRTVIAVVERLPIETLSREVEVGEDDAENSGLLRDAIASFPDDLSGAQARLETTVETVMRALQKPAIGLVAVAALPVLIWLVIGDAIA